MYSSGLRAHVEELALADRLAQGREHRPRVPAGLGGRDALTLGDAVQEVVERHPPGRAVAEWVALPQRRVQLHRKPADQVLDLTAGDALGQRDEDRVRGPVGSGGVEPGALGDPPAELRPGSSCRRTGAWLRPRACSRICSGVPTTGGRASRPEREHELVRLMLCEEVVRERIGVSSNSIHCKREAQLRGREGGGGHLLSSLGLGPRLKSPRPSFDRRSSAGATALSGKAQRRCRSTRLILRVAEREGVSIEQALNCAQTVFATLREAAADKEWSELLSSRRAATPRR